MLAAIGGIILVIAAVLGWTDSSMSVNHLLAVGFIGLALVAFHLAYRLYYPDARRL